MKAIQLTMLLSAAALSAFAQQWEVGGGAGLGFVPGVPVTSTLGSATTGFKTGASFGAFVGQNLYPHISGELHYGFLQSNLRLQSGGTEASFSGVAHVVHYDILYHTNKKGSKVQYFAAVGGGMKLFRGTGKEAAYQPLSQFAYFTKTQAIKPMVSFGAGIKYALAERVILRTEFRDYLTMFPKDLIAPAPGAKFGGVLHNFVPMVSIAYEY
jgi:hypothetical protein